MANCPTSVISEVAAHNPASVNRTTSDFTIETSRNEDSFTKESSIETKNFMKEQENFTKRFSKKFAKAAIAILTSISENSSVNACEMARKLGISECQIRTYLKHLWDMEKIVRIGGRKADEWKILDVDFINFLEMI